MSSKFSTGSVRLIPPSWCKKGMFTGISPTINDRPLSMNAYVHVTFASSGPNFVVDTTVHLSRNEPAGRWEGTVNDGDVQTKVTVADTGSPTVFLLSVTVTELGVPVTGGAWAHQQAVDADRWDTGVLERIHNPINNIVTLHLLA